MEFAQAHALWALGEWKVRQHGVGKRRTWRKLHLGVNEATGKIMSAIVTTNDVSDDGVFDQLIDGAVRGAIPTVRFARCRASSKVRLSRFVVMELITNVSAMTQQLKEVQNL